MSQTEVNLPGKVREGEIVQRSRGWPGPPGTGREAGLGYLDVTWARRWGERTSFGVAAVLAAQSLNVKGVGGLAKYAQTFASSGGSQLPGKLSSNGKDVN